jgi:internalin A
MEVFELCSRLDAYTYVVPQLLPVDEPNFELEGTVLHFVLRFPEFLPDSVFPRLMVKLNPYIKDALRWRTGMVLYKPTIFKAHARIRADKEDKEIRIDLCGKEPRRLLSYIRATIEEIAADFAKLDYDEMVPVPGTKESMEYQYLLEAEKAGQREVFIRGKGSTPIADLLNGVEEAKMRDQTAQIPVNVFISYAHKDDELRQELRSALSPLERLNKLKIWDDRDINAGSEWEKEIFRELEAADIVLCLVSADFIQSEFCYSKELKLAMEAHEKGEKIVIPIRLRKCAWEALDIAKLQGTPTSEWITSSSNKDEVWTEVAHHLEPLVGKLKEQKWKDSDDYIPF